MGGKKRINSKNQILECIFFFVFLTAFFFLERGEMFKRFGDEESSFAGLNYYIVGMIILFGLYVFFNRNNMLHTKLLKRYAVATIVVYVITVFWSLFHVLPTRNVYGYFILPFFAFMFMSVITRIINNDNIIIYSMYIVGVLLAVFYFINYRNNIFYDVGRQSNTSYTVLYFLPIMLCVRNKLLRYFALVITVFAIMFSLKRGGFIALIVGVAVFFYINQISLKAKRLKVGGWLGIIIVAIIGYYLIIKINSSLIDNLMFDRMNDMQNTGGSGREDIYMDVLHLIGTENFGNFMFGNGWCATMSDTYYRLTAHNDFLEVLYDFGIVAFVFYIMFIVELFRLTRLLIKNKSIYAPAMGASLAIFLVNSMVSHIWIYCQYLLIFAVFWGFINAIEKKYQ